MKIHQVFCFVSYDSRIAAVVFDSSEESSEVDDDEDEAVVENERSLNG